MVTGHMGMGAVSKFQTQGNTMTHYHGVMGFYSSDVTIKYTKFQNFFLLQTNLFSFFINFIFM